MLQSKKTKPLQIKSKITTATLAVSASLLLLFATVLAVSSNRPYGDAAEMQFGVTVADVSPTIAISMEDGMVDNVYHIDAIPTATGVINTIPANVRVVANNVYGFNLSIHTPNAGGNMVGVNTGATFSPMPGTISNPIPFETANCNSWGFATPSVAGDYSAAFDSAYSTFANAGIADASWSNFAGVPTAATSIRENHDSVNGTIDEVRTFHFASCVTNAAQPDEYRASVIWTAIAITEPSLPPVAQNGDFIQDVTLATCPTTRTWVVDARDNNTYWIRKIPDSGAGGTDLCWMETNLAYAGGGTWNSGMDWADDRVTLTTMNGGAGRWDAAPVNGVPFVRTDTAPPSGAPVFTSCTGSAPFTSDNCTLPTTGNGAATGANGAQYGFFYNWCAAMGGQSAACNNTEADQNNIDPTINICPAGWRLPVSAATDDIAINDFSALNNAVNNNLTDTDQGLRYAWLGVYAGSVSLAGSFNSVGTFGFYWSSTISNATLSRFLSFGAGSVSPATSATKANGFSVRCVR